VITLGCFDQGIKLAAEIKTPSSSKGNNITGSTHLRQGFGVAGVAIDRFTGEVLDKQIEVVNE
jgi:hypothetical protein